MRLLITTDTIGGVWRFAQELVEGLLEAGDSVALVSFGRSASAAQEAECARLAARWNKAFLYSGSSSPLEWMQENERCYEAGAALLTRVAREFEPELLHSNQFCFGVLPLGIPTVVTAHSDVLSWSRACRNAAPEKSPWLTRYRALVQQGLDEAQVLTAPTHWMLRVLGESFVPPERKLVIPNGRAVSVARTRERRLQAVTAGRLWDEAKDVALLASVRSPMPLVVAGETECDGARAATLAGVELRGALCEEELLRLFEESAVYICTSRYEPFGLSPLEAALCGCAIVVREIEPLQEVWGNAASYFRDAAGLSALLAHCYREPTGLREAQQRAGQRALRYTREAMVMAYRALYAEVKEMAGVS